MDLRMVARTQSSPPKQRRGSLPASPSLNAVHAWGFRDEMGLPTTGPPKDDFLNERSQLSGGVSALTSSEEHIIKRMRKKWTQEETQSLVDGCNTHGVGNWKAILNDPKLAFDAGRTPVDLKDRFRTYFPDAYRQHYPNARTHLSDKIRSTLPNGGSIFEKTRTKRRRPFSQEEDDALRRGYEKHGTLWAQIVQDPIFQSQQRRSTDLRDRFRNAFPDLYEAAGYKPRASSKKAASASHSTRSADSSARQEHARSRASRRRLTYPGMLNCGPTTTASDAVDYSSADEDVSSQAMDVGSASHTFSSPSKVSRHRSMVSATSDPSTGEFDLQRPRLPCRSTSPHAEHDMGSLSSQSHFISVPTSPSSPHRSGALPDSVSRDEDEAKAAWSGLDWLTPDLRPRFPHALTASSLFSANMFGSFSSSPSHDVLDRYDLYSSPLSSTANTFGDYVSEMGVGGSFSEADMDFNAFGGPASSMGFTHHSHVAGDLIFASHHGGHLQHGHGFSLYDQNRLPYAAAAPTPDVLPQPSGSTLGLSNVAFTPDPSSHDTHSQFDPHALDSMLNSDDLSLALLNQGGQELTPIPDAFSTNFSISPAALSSPPHHIGEASGSSTVPPPQATHPAGPNHTTAPSFIPNVPSKLGPGLSMSPISTPSPARRPVALTHLRSASQPPAEQRLMDLRRNPLPSFGAALQTPMATRDDMMQDVWHRGGESYQLPFLDLHYYGVADSHATGMPGRDAH